MATEIKVNEYEPGTYTVGNQSFFWLSSSHWGSSAPAIIATTRDIAFLGRDSSALPWLLRLK